jgi:UDP-glucose 4-epimerase
MRRIGVTGGAGFIGSNLCKKLISLDFEVRILDDFSTGLLDNLAGYDFDVRRGSICDRKAISDFFKGLDFVFHLAARGSVPRSISNPRATFEVNVAGSLEVLEAVREQEIPSVFISSSSVYGDSNYSPKVETEIGKPLSPYAASKACMERMVEAYRNSFDLDIMTFRLFNVFGPFQRFDHEYSAVIPKWINQALRGQNINIFGDGNITRDFTYVEEVTNVLSQSLFKTHLFKEMEVINLAFGREINLNLIAKMTKDFFPHVEIHHGPKRTSDIMNSTSCPKKLFEYFPNIQKEHFHESFSKTVGWITSTVNNIAPHS